MTGGEEERIWRIVENVICVTYERKLSAEDKWEFASSLMHGVWCGAVL